MRDAPIISPAYMVLLPFLKLSSSASRVIPEDCLSTIPVTPFVRRVGVEVQGLNTPSSASVAVGPGLTISPRIVRCEGRGVSSVGVILKPSRGVIAAPNRRRSGAARGVKRGRGIPPGASV